MFGCDFVEMFFFFKKNYPLQLSGNFAMNAQTMYGTPATNSNSMLQHKIQKQQRNTHCLHTLYKPNDKQEQGSPQSGIILALF